MTSSEGCGRKIGPFDCCTAVIGDAFDFLPRLPTDSIDLVLTDPPYDWDSSKRALAHSELVKVSRGLVAVFCPPENPWHHPADQHLFWIKPISTKNTSRRYSRFVEMILLYGRSRWNTQYHWSQYTNVFTDLVEGKTTHPHEKPKSLLVRLLRNHSDVGDVVLDPFCGSKRIPLACQELDRHFLGFEINPDATI